MMKEVRTTTSPLKIRTISEDEPALIEGYALKFNRQSDVLGGIVSFRETIDSDALRSADMSNVVALFNHDENQVLGRTGVNLSLTVDDVGLRYSFTPPNTQLGKDLLENIRSGLISQSSFAFTIDGSEDAEEWRDSKEKGVQYERTIRKIDQIFDVSPVTFPAYPSTEVKVGERSMKFIEELRAKKEPAKPPIWQIEKQKMLRELEIEDILKGIQ